eukprot:407278-Amphidinium_carterae.1
MCHCYKWLRRLVESKVKGSLWHRQARDEFIGLACCWPLFRTSLQACLAPRLLVATDATLSKAGGVITDLSPRQAVALWSRQKWNRVGLTYQGIEGDLHTPLFGTTSPLQRDCSMEDAIQTLQFREIFRYRFRERKHINHQEMIAWRTGIKHLSRNLAFHDCRVLSLLDSQAVCCSVRKGRSTSHALNALLQSVAGTCLLARLDVIPLWVASAANAADDPTRISKVRDAVPADLASENFIDLASENFWLQAEDWRWPLEAT